MKDKKIVILYGGWNSEREVSLDSGNAIYDAMRRIGFRDVYLVDYSKNTYEELKIVKPDLVFNALHGKYGEDGCVQGMLEILQIPYTHSSLLASSLCMDKIITKKLAKAAGIKIVDFEILHQGQNQQNEAKLKKIGYPLVIKPIDEGSSIGIEVFLNEGEFDLDSYSWQYGPTIMLEKYIKGQEVQVAVIDSKAVGAIEIRPKKLFYDYECKYSKGMSEYIMPAQIDSKKYKEVLDLSQKVFVEFGCSAISRVDFILSEKDQEFYFLENNTQPGFTELSLVPQIANHVGISFDEIVEYLINKALKDCEK